MTKYQVYRLEWGGGSDFPLGPTHAAFEISTVSLQAIANLFLSGARDYSELIEFVTWLDEPDGLMCNDSHENDDDFHERTNLDGLKLWETSKMEDWKIRLQYTPTISLCADVKHTHGQQVWTANWIH